ncbi:hypothetical protein DSO57_1024408 [Entomophthora muscae]|uniref:Uncharacterized protein n=1 Tax=Entomophthora muscae TaxID=34485 RepID=A0ACC2U0H3_9FUNG|nr:hypothetical protein DSO57_1024408 [Entomophthora muscae]
MEDTLSDDDFSTPTLTCLSKPIPPKHNASQGPRVAMSGGSLEKSGKSSSLKKPRTSKPNKKGDLKRTLSVPASKKITSLFGLKRLKSSDCSQQSRSVSLEGPLQKPLKLNEPNQKSSVDLSTTKEKVPCDLTIDSDLICPICDEKFEELASLERHVNNCLDHNPSSKNSPTVEKYTAPKGSINCPICDQDISHLTTSFQERHVNHLLGFHSQKKEG